MGKFVDLTGQKFGILTVIKRAENRGKHTEWVCRCACGNFTIQRTDHLKRGAVVSCGCVGEKHRREANTTHCMSKTRLYRIWAGMKDRCYNSKNIKYKDYGGRGIAVCSEWFRDFQAFYDWSMQNGYQPDLTIDRTDVNGNYEPSNCRWATYAEQSNNTRRNVVVSYNGCEYTLKDFCGRFNLDYNKTYSRIHVLNWPIEKVIATP